jgi:hypothetical protein
MAPTATQDLFTAPVGAAHYSPNLGAILTVIGRSWPAGTDVAEVLAGRARADVVRLTADGRGWYDGWHTGPECGDVVYVELHRADGSGMHGWIDRESRRLVQAG